MFYLWVISTLVVLAVLGFLANQLYQSLIKKIHVLPIKDLGYENIPAIPLQIAETIDAVYKLSGRSVATYKAKYALSNRFTINGIETTGYEFIYGNNSTHISFDSTHKLARDLEKTAMKMVITNKPVLLKLLKSRIVNEQSVPNRLKRKDIVLQDLSLESPDQLSITLTNYGKIYETSKSDLKRWSATLTDVDIANEEFWATITEYGAPFNLSVLQKVERKTLLAFKEKYSQSWNPEFEKLSKQGLLYAIDMTIFEDFESAQIHGVTRFTPGTCTFLKQNPNTKKLTPISVWISGYEGKHIQCYEFGSCTDGAWLYALQAAKVSITVYGIWLGHVYQLHIVTGALQMTMFKSFSQDHPIYELLAPMSKYLIGFDGVLLLLWEETTPPTSISKAKTFLDLIEKYSINRKIFDDDPLNQLEQNGIKKGDFSSNQDWDQYELVGNQLKFWSATKEYVSAVIENTYSSDQDVKEDKQIQKWIENATSKKEGNIRGISKIETKESLVNLLTSYLYRITIHGAGRFVRIVNPGMIYAGNFPPCLQKKDLPDPKSELSTSELMKYMPNTGTLGGMMSFGSLFCFSAPYESAIPLGGVEQELFFKDGDSSDPRNVALINFRLFLKEFIDTNIDDSEVSQWPRSIET